MTFNWRKHLNTLGPLVGLVFVVLIFSVLLGWKDALDHREFSGDPGMGFFTALGQAEFSGLKAFLGGANGKIILTQTVIVALGALGMTLIIVSGGIDLSAGSVVALSSVVGAQMLNSNCPLAGVVLIAIATGGLVAAIKQSITGAQIGDSLLLFAGGATATCRCTGVRGPQGQSRRPIGVASSCFAVGIDAINHVLREYQRLNPLIRFHFGGTRAGHDPGQSQQTD